MPKPPRLTGTVMSGHLARASAALSVMRQRFTQALQGASTDPLDWVQAIGDLQAYMDRAESGIESATELTRANGHPTDLNPLEQAKRARAEIDKIIAELEAL